MRTAMETIVQDHYYGLTNRLYMMLQSIECCDLYISAHHLLNSDSLDMNVAYMWFYETKRSEDFQKKIAQRYPVLMEYCTDTNITVDAVNDYGTLYELYYVLNTPDITEETLPDYLHSLDDLINQYEHRPLHPKNEQQQTISGTEHVSSLDDSYLKEHGKLLRPLYHSLTTHQLQATPEKLTELEHRFEERYRTLRTSVSRFLPAA